MGRFDNLLGYESTDAYKNPNFSRSYGFSVEPTEHTGLLADYKPVSAVDIQVGVANTVSTGLINARNAHGNGGSTVESKKSIISLISLTAPDSWGPIKGSALYAGVDNGFGGAATGLAPNGTTTIQSRDRTETYVGLTLNTPVTGLTFGAAWDYINHLEVGSALFGGPGLVPGVDAGHFNSVAGYGSFKVTEKLTTSARVEYAKGNALNGAVPTHKILAVTGTVQYDLWANVLSRLEVRWDHAADGTTPYGGTAVSPAPTKKNWVSVAANVIYKF